jgi:hypothetical protein
MSFKSHVVPDIKFFYITLFLIYSVAAAMRHWPPREIRHLLIINAPVYNRL